MALANIEHFHVKEGVDEANDHRIVIAPYQHELRRIARFSRKEAYRDIDLARLLSDRGFSPQDCRHVSSSLRRGEAGKRKADFYFCAASEPDPFDPKTTGLYFTNRRPLFLAPRPYMPAKVRRKVKIFKIVQYPMDYHLEDVVYAASVGRQGMKVPDGFFEEFPWAWAFAERRYAERISELIAPEAREEYRGKFLDNWDDTHSM